MDRFTPSSRCKCPVCDRRGRALSALAHEELTAIVTPLSAEPSPQTASGIDPVGVAVAGGLTLVSGFLSSSALRTQIAAFQAPFTSFEYFAVWVEPLLPLGSIIAVAAMLIGLRAAKTDTVRQAFRPVLPYQWAPRFLDLRLCMSCRQLFDGDGDRALATPEGFDQLMARADKRAESRTWILKGGFAGERARSAQIGSAGNG